MANAINSSQLYPATFTANEVITEGATVTLVPGVYSKIGEYVVKADEIVGMGRGGYSALNDAIGRLFAVFKDNSNEKIKDAKFRIMLESSQDMPIGSRPVYIDVDLSAIDNGAETPSERFVFPFDGTLLSKDKKFVFLIKNNSSGAITLSKANSVVALDVTRGLV